ncbi:MAG TPA: hypothetical protein VD978_11795 [Azospirillum sp.]|nr:hypothetical protein [Azospirillum sp.]
MVLTPIARWLRMALLSLLATLPATAAADPPTVTVGVLKFGTVTWELDTIHHNGFDVDAGITLNVVELASNQATQIALQAGSVDAIVGSWCCRRRPPVWSPKCPSPCPACCATTPPWKRSAPTCWPDPSRCSASWPEML